MKKKQQLYNFWRMIWGPNTPGCAIFLSYCMNKADVGRTVFTRFAYCPEGYNWFKNRGKIKKLVISLKKEI